MTKLVPLGPEAVAYMREELARPDPLTDALRRVPFETGRVTTFVPDSASPEEVHKFGAVFRTSNMEGGQAYLAMKEYVHRVLQLGGTRILIMGRLPELPIHHRGLSLPRLGRDWAEWFTCEGRVYFCATQTSDLERVRDVFSDVQALTTFGVLARDLVNVPPRRADLTRAELADVVQRATHVLVGAYDSTGMLIWSK